MSLIALEHWSRHARLRMACVFLLLAGALGVAQSQMVRLEGADEGGYSWSRTWIDFNNDGRDDYCAVSGDNGERLVCYPSNGSLFGPKQTFYTGGDTTPGSLRWADVNGDGQIDVCRYGVVFPNGQFVCRLGPQFTVSVAGGAFPLASRYTVGVRTLRDVHFTDINADGRTDLCYIVSTGSELRCLLSNGTGFGSVTPAWTLSGFNGGTHAPETDQYGDWPSGFYDFNGDGYPDFCRVMDGAFLRCTLSGPNGFAGEVSSATIAVPYKEGAGFVDMNADGKTDFCRIVGTTGDYRLSCTFSNGVGWESAERFSAALTPGDPAMRWWVDINGDSYPDFCRATDSATLQCRLSRGDGEASIPNSAFAYSDVSVAVADFGLTEGGRAFCDAAGTGIQTFCRVNFRTVNGPEVCYEGMEYPTCMPSFIENTYGLITGLTDSVLQARQPLLTSYTDGVGAETRITYLPMSSQDVYTRSGPGTYPRALIAQPRAPVVYETRAWQAGTQNALTGNARYFYKDLRTDTLSGSRGFRERWIFTEGSNSLDHTVFFQGLGPDVDASSRLDDLGEVGLVKYQERFAVANGVLPNQSNVGTPTQRQSFLKQVTSAARQLSAVPLAQPTETSPFLLVQTTTNTLSDTDPDELPPSSPNWRYRYIGASTARSWDWNGTSLVALPTVDTTTRLSYLGNVRSIVQTTTAPNGAWWRQTTTNTYDAEDRTNWILGRLTKARVTSEMSLSANAQIDAYPRKAGQSQYASDMSSATPAVPQPLAPGVLSAILQLLLDD